MRRDTDPDAGLAKLLQPAQVGGDRRIAEAVEPAARVGDEQQHELDPGLARSLDRRVCLGLADVVELTDRGVPGR